MHGVKVSGQRAVNCEIRKAVLDDAESLADLILDLGWFDHYFEDMTLHDARRRVKRHLERCLADDSHTLFVAQDAQGRMAGYAAVHWLPYLFLPGPEGFISELFVAEAARGQGIGARLLRAVQDEARARGCSRLSLLNMRDRESYHRRFYAKQGWTERPDAANFVLRLG